MRLLAVVLAVCGGCARCGSHGPYVVHRVRGPISVDGVLLEPSWDRAERTGRFVRSIDGKPAAAATEARLLWDDDALYAAFQCEDKDVATPFTKNDESLYTSNVVELFLNPSGDLARYVEIEVAPSNALFDASFTGRRAGMDLGWSSRALH
ncbi:MAG: carbohydrate-binding family 9-like protein, partial [Myxococcales bacterium]